MKMLLPTDPDRTLVENHIQGEVISEPLINEEHHLVHDIFYADSLRLYTSPADPLGSLLERDKDYILYKQDTIGTDLSGFPCYRSVIFLVYHPTVYADYQVYGDLLPAELYNEVRRDVEGVAGDLDDHEEARGTNAHGSTTAASPGQIMCRDGSGQAEVGPPTTANHLVRLADLQAEAADRADADTALAAALAEEAVNRQDAIDEHTNAEGVLAHGATEELEPGAIVCRDENGQAEVGPPTTANHMVRRLDLEAEATARADADAALVDDIEGGTTVAGNSSKLEGKTLAEVIELAAGASLSDLMPVGTVLMYDANNPGGAQGGASGPWVDYSTMPGWYACIPENAAKGCPNLVDRFPMGKVVAGVGASGGAASVTLAVGQLPSHNHSINHGHSASSGYVSADHVHTVAGGSHSHSYTGTASAGGNGEAYPLDGGRAFAGRGIVSSGQTSTQNGYIHADGGHVHSVSGITANHVHAITVNDFSGNSGFTGSGSAINIRNPYYSLIFIRKCA